MKTKDATKTLICAIKEWMKKHPRELVPNSSIVLRDLNISLDEKVSNYTQCKRQAFKELEKAGYKLSYLDASHSIACIEGFTAPENIGEKVAAKMLGMDAGEEDENEEIEISDHPLNSEYNSQSHKEKPVTASDKPNVYIHIHKIGLSPVECAGCADFVAGIASLPNDTRLEFRILVREIKA